MEGNLKKITSLKLAALESPALEEARQGLPEGKDTHFKQLHIRAISGKDKQAEEIFERKIVPIIKSWETRNLLSFADIEIQLYDPKLKQKQFYCSELYRRAIKVMDQLAFKFLYANWERIITRSWNGSENHVQEVFSRFCEKIYKKAFKYETIEGLGRYLKEIYLRIKAEEFKREKRVISSSIGDNIEKLAEDEKAIIKSDFIRKDVLINGKRVLNDSDKIIISLTLDGKKAKEILSLHPKLREKFGDNNKKLLDFRRDSYWRLYKVLQECLTFQEKEKYQIIFHKLTLGIPKFVSTEDVILMEEKVETLFDE